MHSVFFLFFLSVPMITIYTLFYFYSKRQTSEKRKSLLDEMAIGMTSKSDEISRLQGELARAEEDSAKEIGSLKERVNGTEARSAEADKEAEEARKEKEALAEKLAAAQEEASTQAQRHARYEDLQATVVDSPV